MLAGGLVLVGAAPRVPGNVLLEVRPFPAGRVARALLERLEPLLGIGVPPDIELELIERRSEELDLHPGRRLARLAHAPEEARPHQAGEDAQDDDDDQELDQREAGLVEGAATAAGARGHGGARGVSWSRNWHRGPHRGSSLTLRIASRMARTIVSTTRAEHDDDGGLERRHQAPDRDADLALVRAGDPPEHVVEPAGLLAHADHVDDQGGEGARLRHGPGQSLAALHAAVDGDEGVGDHAVPGTLPGDVERAEQAARPTRAGCRACGWRGRPRPSGPRRPRSGARGAPRPAGAGRPRTGPPPATRRRPRARAAASAHQYVTNTSLSPSTRRVGRGSVWPRSARMTAKRGRTKVRRKMTAAGAHDEEERRVDQGRDDRLAELARSLEVLGQPAERDLEHAAPLAGADRVDVETRERPRLMAGQRVGERRSRTGRSASRPARCAAGAGLRRRRPGRPGPARAADRPRPGWRAAA